MYRMGENICKQHDQKGLNFQTAHTTQQQKNQTQLKKMDRRINIFPDKKMAYWQFIRMKRCSTLIIVQFSYSVTSDSLRPHGTQHTRPPCPSPTPRVYSNSCPMSQWCHPTISSSIIPFSFCLQSSPASGSFPMSQFFASRGQNIGASASASVFPINIQDWLPLGFTGWISLQSKGLSRVFSNTTV